MILFLSAHAHAGACPPRRLAARVGRRPNKSRLRGQQIRPPRSAARKRGMPETGGRSARCVLTKPQKRIDRPRPLFRGWAAAGPNAGLVAQRAETVHAALAGGPCTCGSRTALAERSPLRSQLVAAWLALGGRVPSGRTAWRRSASRWESFCQTQSATVKRKSGRVAEAGGLLAKLARELLGAGSTVLSPESCLSPVAIPAKLLPASSACAVTRSIVLGTDGCCCNVASRQEGRSHHMLTARLRSGKE
eukprot:scaffold44854_cov33-Tisochrysis_lutea.AAC.2